MHKKIKFWTYHILWRHIICGFFALFAIFPVFFMATAALDKYGQLSTSRIIPSSLSFDNFSRLFEYEDGAFFIWMRNAISISIAIALLNLFVGTSAAYAISRYRFYGRRNLLMIVVLLGMFPTLLSLTTLYLTMSSIGDAIPGIGVGTRLGLILLFTGGALSVGTWFLKNYIDSIPTELDDAAKMDGAHHFYIFARIVVPLCAPVLAIQTLFGFLGGLNEYLITAIILGTERNVTTVAVGMQSFLTQNAQNWGAFAAGASIITFPVIGLFIYLQKHIAAGLTAGAVNS